MSFESYLNDYFNGFDEGDTFLIVDDSNNALEVEFIEFIFQSIPIVTLKSNKRENFIITDMDITRGGTIIIAKCNDIKYRIFDKFTYNRIIKYLNR